MLQFVQYIHVNTLTSTDKGKRLIKAISFFTQPCKEATNLNQSIIFTTKMLVRFVQNIWSEQVYFHMINSGKQVIKGGSWF